MIDGKKAIQKDDSGRTIAVYAQCAGYRFVMESWWGPNSDRTFCGSLQPTIVIVELTDVV